MFHRNAVNRVYDKWSMIIGLMVARTATMTDECVVQTSKV